MKPLLSLLFLILILTSACRPTDVYHVFQTLPEQGWEKHDTLFFKPDSCPAGLRLYPFIELRHTAAYPYRSLWLIIAHHTADSAAFTNDTIEYTLTDREGRFNGSGLGALFQKSYSLSPITLDKGQKPTFKIIHYMLDTPLRGITDIGIRISSEPRQSARK